LRISNLQSERPEGYVYFLARWTINHGRNLGFDLTPIIKTDKDGRSDI
jgi:hypothetical protein